MIHDGQYDTRFPLNINDEDLIPGATEFPRERLGYTDMTFSLIRFEITATYRRLKCSLTVQPNTTAEDLVAHRQQLIIGLEQRLYENYLQYCNTTVIVHWLSATISWLVLSKLRLSVYDTVRPGDMSTEPKANIREFLFGTSVDTIELSILLETSHRNIGNWSWIFKNNNQWHALSFVLAELCLRPLGPDVDRAWLAINSAYNSWKSEDAQAQKEIWPTISRLMDQATQARRRQLDMSCIPGSTLSRQYRRSFPVVESHLLGKIDDPRQSMPKWPGVFPHVSEPSSHLNHSCSVLNPSNLPVGDPVLALGMDNRFGELPEDVFFPNADFSADNILDFF